MPVPLEGEIHQEMTVCLAVVAISTLICSVTLCTNKHVLLGTGQPPPLWGASTAAFHPFATRNVVHGPSAKALPGSLLKCRLLGPAPDLLKQNLHCPQIPR